MPALRDATDRSRPQLKVRRISLDTGRENVVVISRGSIQESEVAALNRRNMARGRAEVIPIYTQPDAVASLQLFSPVEYEAWVDVVPGVRARYWNAGHLLGSASMKLS